jgi:hypothetical protein
MDGLSLLDVGVKRVASPRYAGGPASAVALADDLAEL